MEINVISMRDERKVHLKKLWFLVNYAYVLYRDRNLVFGLF